MALKAEELMIGNWVIDHTGNYYQVTPLGIVHQSQYDIAGAEGYKSIPIDESILLKCGFEKKVTPLQALDVIEYYLNDWLPYLKERKLGDETWYQVMNVADCNVVYLHTLQNLYSLLTGGQHLTFKP